MWPPDPATPPSPLPGPGRSCLGLMFAPHHQAAADELVRVCRPGGTIGLVSWTPDGFVGRIDLSAQPADFRDYFKARYGPAIAVYQPRHEASAAGPR
jgi:hypothetical protein